MATTKWQCSQCGTTQTTQGLRPSVGGFCGKAQDHKHKWAKVTNTPTKWRCMRCGTSQTTPNGLKPSVGGFCGASSDHKHRWTKES